jgi:hypothetical protein
MDNKESALSNTRHAEEAALHRMQETKVFVLVTTYDPDIVRVMLG